MSIYFYIHNRQGLSCPQILLMGSFPFYPEASTIVFGPNADPFLMPLEAIAIYSFLTKTKSNFTVGDPISSFELNFQTLSQESQGYEATQHQQDI